MAIDLSGIQSHKDRTLREILEADRGVQLALTKFKERSSGFGFGARRRLLTGALRLTRSMAPEVADALAASKEAIGFDRPVEIYVRAEPVFNAFCLHNPAGPIIIGLSSRLLENFTPAELQFVIGHELGHAVYNHLGIPMPWTATIEDLAGPIVSRETSLKLYLWCRAAELTADRVGLVCSRDPAAAASSFFKLASGVASDRIRPDLEAFAAQVDSLASAPEARARPRDEDDTLDCFSTHPYSPVRVRALVAFSKSKAYQAATGLGEGTVDDETLRALVDRDLRLMEPEYLHESSADAKLMRKVLYHASVLVAASSQGIDDTEIEAMRVLLGADEVPDNLRQMDLQVIRKNFESQAQEAVKEISLADRARLVGHVTIVAAADGVVDDDELAEMTRVADALQVDPMVIHRTVQGAAQPMD